MLLGCGSVCVSLTPQASWQWLCLGSSPETLCGSLQLPGCLACTSDTTTQHCALLDRWLAVSARAPRSCSLQQRVLLTVRTGLRGSLPLLSVGGVQHHSNTTCMLLWAASTSITKAYIAASCHGVVCRFVQHRWRVIDLVTLSSGFFHWKSLFVFPLSHATSLHVCS